MTSAPTDQEHVLELRAARAEFEHRLRQLNDIAERNGGVFAPIEAERKQVRQNLKQTEQELKDATDR